MARKPLSKAVSLVSKAKPNLPQHNLPAPFAALQYLGVDGDIDLYQEIEQSTSARDVPAVLSQLTEMALDETYYSYSDTDDPDPDPRCFAPLNAIRSLAYFNDRTMAVVPRLIPLFASEDDNLREELPLMFACMGPAAVETLEQLTLAPSEHIYIREGAASSLVEIVETWPGLRDRLVGVIEDALDGCVDREMCGYFVLNLMDLQSSTSIPSIVNAFAADRVDPEVVVLQDVFDHYGMVPEGSAEKPKEPHLVYVFDEEEFDEEEEERTPYVAEVKVGRNDPCPCGSGKKYKKCHGG